MCGRYRLKDPKAAFDWLEVEPVFDFRPRFNIAPGQLVPVVCARGEVEPMQWGIVPKWARETSKALINARCESIREKRSFKSAFSSRRCLMPADGFYEWTMVGKRPHLITINGGAPFAIGGIWEPGADNNRCCLLTTAANAVAARVHNRMPVIVRREDWEEWFSPGELAEPGFQRIMEPYGPEGMAALEVSPLVNSASIDDPRCCEPGATRGAEAPRKLRIARDEPPKPGGQQTFGF
jgi:putative SOS response-associated peptidase YedK